VQQSERFECYSAVQQLVVSLNEWQEGGIVAHISPVDVLKGYSQGISTHQHHLTTGILVLLVTWAPAVADILYTAATKMLYRERFVRKHPGFQAAEVEAWATLTGDANPIHTSTNAAADAGVTHDCQSCAASFEWCHFPHFLTA